MTDTYTIYSEWFLHHYGRPFGVSREEFERWCRKPRASEKEDFDIATERKEGWAYG